MAIESETCAVSEFFLSSPFQDNFLFVIKKKKKLKLNKAKEADLGLLCDIITELNET